ncbi:alpha-amylase [Marmoricola sp. Leaf446]|uniref:alpha-amylase family protein n=1 Tax=Marmoricola sp. Leaf446 TaxID=1736379 RepID=UPI0006FC0F18|nr:alpha-amylase family protein [Marmoricola sp. Leaf446]KQT91117.1 alpha-amylase [Marmoricola sp. Leaf446]
MPEPRAAVPGLDEVLAPLPVHRRQLFEARVARWRPDLDAALRPLYDAPAAVGDRLVLLAARAFAARSEELHALDLERSLAPDWFQRPDVVGYAAYAERFGGDLAGVAGRASYLQELGVRYLHLMPLLTPRPAPNDGGYAVMDYRTVRSDLGTVDDVARLTAELRGRGISLCLDLVLNHVAREHEWARRAVAGDQVHRDYFLVFEDRELPDAYEQTLPEVFPDFAPGSFSHDAELDAWVWTTFNDYQWDLDWSNPAVLCEFADIICFWANHGVEVFRLDAIAFTWKRMGTSCQNQPEVHALTQALRTVARIAAPSVLFKAEAIVGPQDLVAYLGQGAHHGKVSDLAYHNSLMVQIWSMLATRDVWLASRALQQLPAPPSTTAWVTYARCHDDIGWAVDDADAAAVGVTGHGHRAFLSDFYSGDFPGSWARGLVFQENEETRDRRISGSLASLAGLEAGDPDAPARIRLAHALVLGFGGVPVIWMGDELGLLNDAAWDQVPEHAEDNRWVHRPVMPWPEDGSTPRDAHGIGDDLRQLVAARRALPHLHASVGAEVLDPADPGVLLVLRRHPLGPMLGAYNVTGSPRPVPVEVLHSVGLDPADLVDRTSGEQPVVRGGAVLLPAYGAAWLTSGG